MNILTRRTFMQRSGAAAVGMALGSLLNVPGFLRRAVAGENGYTWNGNKVLFVFLRGGNDGLNTIVPLGDSAYGPSIRPTIAIPAPDDPLTTGLTCPVNPQAGRAIDLGNGFAGLHPSLVDLCPVYNAGDLAVIHRVGYPDQSRSHFDSERYWETGVPRDDVTQEGMFYRAMVETGLHETQVLPAVSLQSTMPLLIKGDFPMANISDPQRYDLLGVYAAARQKHIDSIARIHGLNYPAKKNRDITFPTGDRFVNSIASIEDIDFQDNSSPEFFDVDGTTRLFPTTSSELTQAQTDKNFGSGTARNFFRSLKYSAQILAGTDAVVAGTELGGFDTHNTQGGPAGGVEGTHAERMAYVGWAIYALKQYLSHPSVGLWDKTVVVTLSEFGRTTEENSSFGTDHAEAGTMFVAGGPVQHGVFQCDGNGPSPWVTGPEGSMFDINGRYLSRSVDYRSVMGEIIRDHLGTSQDQLNRIVPGYAIPEEMLLGGGTLPDGANIAGELGLLA